VSGSDTIDHDATPAAFAVLLGPNPNRGSFDLYFRGQVTTPVQIDIYDLMGRRVYTQTDPDPELSSIWVGMVPGYLALGIYIVRIRVNGETIDRKMLVE
jgi:hypothetical protein